MTGEEPAGGVVLRPPVDVMRPRPRADLPAPDEMPGGVQYGLKLDGFRALAFVLEGGAVVLQSRSRRDLSPDFPQVARHLAERLPAGIVLDGELCAYRDGRLSFPDLLRSRRDRERAGVPVSYVAFDLLAVPGRDLRGLPLRVRWELLGVALAGIGAPVERVTVTRDREVARGWFRDLRKAGVEGIVAKDLGSTYRSGHTWAWRKVRHADTEDAELLGLVVDGAGRARAAVVRTGEGRTAVTSPRLTPAQARELRAGAGPQREWAAAVPVEEYGGLVRRRVAGAPAVWVEVAVTGGRHGLVRFVRVRADHLDPGPDDGPREGPAGG
ncbi:DNA ligase [Streptomyces sp. BI20]|uniref:ATP-dependent DNA ligase n=1 Tax=Streptomyces sp. BI20 TaxID=3403460 RepID=UPI003C7190D9